MDQLQEIRKLAAMKYTAKKSELDAPAILKEPMGSRIPVMTQIYCKNPEGHFILLNGKITKIDDLIYEHPFCALGLGRNKPMSEFGKSINFGYIKSNNGDIFKINDKTFFVPYLNLNNKFAS
jgi:hypothetical protein